MLSEVITWFRETGDIPTRTVEHIRLSAFPVLSAALIAIPIGLYIGHKRRFEFVAITAANLGRAVPSFAILALALPISIQFGLGLGFWPTAAALFLLALPPILTNTYVGVKSVDEDTIEASRGVGMTELQVVRTVRLPLAAPLIVAGVRTAAVQVVATATLAALVAGGGYGTYIVFGFRASDDGSLLGGGILVALLALVTEFGLGFAEKIARARTGRRPRPVRPGEADIEPAMAFSTSGEGEWPPRPPDGVI